MELEFIHWLRGRLPGHPRLRVGPGDDAAVLDVGRGLVVTTDMVTDGVDFHLERCDPRRAGRKALAVNLSDLAAMAAKPLAVVVSVALPRKGAAELARALVEGMIPLAQEFDVAFAGGDTNTWDGPLAISVTALGEVTEHGALLRSGAKPGDAIVVTGSFGGSILGKHFDFQPRIREALYLNANYRIHACIDVSDGLARDLSHVANASGCGAVLDVESIPLAETARELAATGDGRTALDHALGDGEDFELLLAMPPEEAARVLADQPLDVPLARIGEFTVEQGLWRRTSLGQREPLEPTGFEHKGHL